MRIAVFSDIHGNREALASIIEDIKKEKINEVICLGDTIGIGPNPSECLDLLIENNIDTDWRKLKPLYIQPPPVFGR